MLLKNVRYLVTQDEKRQVLENVDLLIERDRIAKIGKGLEDEGDVIDCSDRIVLPGLINAHTHLGMTNLRGLHDDEELNPWLKKVVAAEKQLSEEEISAGAHLGIVEALRSGTTTIVDMYDPTLPAATAAQNVGIRYIGMQGFFTVFEAPDSITIPDDLSPRVTFGLGPHSIYGVDPEFLKKIRQYATEHKRLVHTHLAETRKERAESRERHGKLPLELLEELRFLGPDVTLVHAMWLTKYELDLIARMKAPVVHCPQSNMKLAGGSALPLKEMQERGIIVALGTDSVASNNNLDMFREMHVAALLHKHQYWDAAAAAAQTVLDMATRNGAQAYRLNKLGSLELGNTADIITLDLGDVNLQPHSKERIVSHIVYAANGMNVSEVIVDGKLILKDKIFVKG